MNTKVKTEERIERLVMAIGKGSLPRRELIADLGLRQDARRNFRDNYLKPATNRGLVRMQFPEVPSRPEQTYLLTEKGLAFWEELQSKKDQAWLDARWVAEVRIGKRTRLEQKNVEIKQKRTRPNWGLILFLGVIVQIIFGRNERWLFYFWADGGVGKLALGKRRERDTSLDDIQHNERCIYRNSIPVGLKKKIPLLYGKERELLKRQMVFAWKSRKGGRADIRIVFRRNGRRKAGWHPRQWT